MKKCAVCNSPATVFVTWGLDSYRKQNSLVQYNKAFLCTVHSYDLWEKCKASVSLGQMSYSIKGADDE